MKVLVVDDSEPIRSLLSLHAKSLGHEVHEASDGEHALEVAVGSRFELIVSDIRMPRLDGLELLRAVKKADPEVDVIMVTGYGDMPSSLEALRSGASDYLMKPVNLEELTLAIEAVERRRTMTRKLREQEDLLAQAQKMADLGLVAAGVAHEINNPNTFIRGNVQTLEKFWCTVSEYCQQARDAGVAHSSRLSFVLREMPNILEAMLEGTERIKKIVDSMTAFTRQNEDPETEKVDLNRCVAQAVEQTQARHPEVRIDFCSQSDLPPVMAGDRDLVEIVEELIRNGIRSVEANGEPRIQVRTWAVSDENIVLQVRDNGRGIKPDFQSRVFTPFSTDPRIGRPGLGLSKVYATVRNWGGEIFLNSEEGHGATFIIKLSAAPRAEDA